jgi:hypothetical protein
VHLTNISVAHISKLAANIMTHKTINISILSLTALTIIAFAGLPLDSEKYDIRSEILLTLLGGGIHTGLIVAIVITLTYKTIKTENEKKKSGLKSFLMLLLSLGTFIIFIFTLIFIPQPYEDTVIYKSTTGTLNYIIVQYYETGITGNPHHRITRTSNIETLFRKITLLPDTLLKTINVGERYSDNPIKTFRYENEIYEIDTYFTLDGQNISR